MTFQLKRGSSHVSANGFSVLAPTHKQLGIETEARRIAVLAHFEGAGRRSEVFDPVTETWSGSHLFRATITLPKV